MKKVGITVAAAVCVVLLCVGFYFMKNSDGSQASKENLTVVQRINEKNLADDYPKTCLLYTSPSPRDRQKSRMPSSA